MRITGSEDRACTCRRFWPPQGTISSPWIRTACSYQRDRKAWYCGFGPVRERETNLWRLCRSSKGGRQVRPVAATIRRISKPLCPRSPVATWRRQVCPSSSQRPLDARIAASSTIPPARRATASSGPRYRQSRAYLAGSFCRRSAATSTDPPNCFRLSLPKRSAPSDWAGMTIFRPLPDI